MPSSALPAPLIPNAGDALSQYRSGYTVGKDQQQSAVMSEAGNLAASGNMRGGANALMRGGLLREGMAMVDKIQADARAAKTAQLAAAKQKADVIAEVAISSTTPEAWATNMGKLKEMGYDTTKYMDFGVRDIAIAVAGKTKMALDMELDRRKAEDGGRETFGVKPEMIEDADGNLVPMQFSSKGRAKSPDLPEGYKIPTIQQKKADAARGEALGKSEGEGQAAIPAAVTSVLEANEVAEELVTHPGIDLGTGGTTYIPNRRGSQAYNFEALNERAKSQTFMLAREGLKGAGQVTDFEGGKGETAIAQLDTAQSKEAYTKAVKNVQKMMLHSVNDLLTKSGLPRVNSLKELKRGGPLAAKQSAAVSGATQAGPSAGTPGAPPARLKFNPQTGELE